MIGSPPGSGNVRALRELSREAFRRFVWPVAVLTYRAASVPRGMTVSSLTSLSLDPPALVVCINRNSRTYQHLVVGARLGVALLASDQLTLADRLSVRGGDKILRPEEVDQEEELGAPVLRGAVAFFDLEVASITDAYSHIVAIALVTKVRFGPGGLPLGYHQGRFIEISARELSLANS